MHKITLCLLTACLLSAQAQAQSQNDANNPLSPRPLLSLHDYYAPKLHNVDGAWANQTVVRAVLPNKTFGLPQLWRLNVPVVSLHHDRLGSKSGLGDITLMDIFMRSGEHFSYGMGPMLVMPTASDDRLGQGKWQIGSAAAIVANRSWGLAGGLMTFQQSFAGDSDRDRVRMLTFQPALFYNLPNGYYLRSSAVWTFDLEQHTRHVPVGLGIGKVMKLGSKSTVNAFIEPQYSVEKKGAGVPEWQIFGGFNIQF
ncbi:MAG TPA: hypothetical protein VL003_05385 [Pusillimonas sp.]|uniref:hypothetical protein n=1 Tax=Pusillimonas sp. TaxID=3040095 RepID=UPI002BBD2D9D|nr:hypothetical protein [Pusillimonas sp.]HUH87469.1 hypothetical protein [Pusillimonas sp.]